MKRILTLLAAITMVMSAMAQSAGITLSTNNGEELRFFRADQLQQAIDEAQANDILYFASGYYDLNQINHKITKPLTFIGTGAQGVDKGGTNFSYSYYNNLEIDIQDNFKKHRNWTNSRIHNSLILMIIWMCRCVGYRVK